jgi:hypothetical protein
MDYEKALNDFKTVAHLTYFEPTEHTRICDLCYLCLHELDLHAEGEYWHPIKERKTLLKFCQKWGAAALKEEPGLNYAVESQLQFNLGLKHKKSDCAYI